VRKKELEEAKA